MPSLSGFRQVHECSKGRVVVRDTRPQDGAAVDQLFRDVLAEGRWFITDLDEYAGTPRWHTHRIERFGERTNACHLAAWLAGELVGVVTLEGGGLRRMRHVVRLEIYVDPACRGLGIGGALMSAAIRWAEQNPLVHKLGLTVFEDNTRAVRLYESAGFRIEGRRVDEYRDPDGTLRADLLMARAIGGVEPVLA